jgi:hypothetical protein
MIALNHHAQFNKNIYYILVYTFTYAFPILLDYNLALYYQAQHYLLTRGCDHLIGRCRDIKVDHQSHDDKEECNAVADKGLFKLTNWFLDSGANSHFCHNTDYFI